jgi:hypothetical protein
LTPWFGVCIGRPFQDPVQRLFHRVNDGEFTSLQLADWLIGFSPADLKYQLTKHWKHLNGTGVCIRSKTDSASLPRSLFKTLAIWAQLQRVTLLILSATLDLTPACLRAELKILD